MIYYKHYFKNKFHMLKSWHKIMFIYSYSISKLHSPKGNFGLYLNSFITVEGWEQGQRGAPANLNGQSHINQSLYNCYKKNKKYS